MKRFLLISLVLTAALMASAGQYCHELLTVGSKSIYLTAKHVSGDQYQILIESTEQMSGLGGSFINVNGVGGYQLNAPDHFVLATDGKSITCDITSNVAPTIYTPLYVLFQNGGETNFGQLDIDFSATCEGGNPTPGPGPDPDPDPEPTGDIDWTKIDWLGNGSGVEANTNKYKIALAEGQQVANIQVAPWDDNNVGIYTWFESGVNNVSVPAGIQGAGVLLRLSAFVNQVTEVTVEAATKTYVFHVYYADGTPVATSLSTLPNTLPNTRKFIENGRLYFEKSGHIFDALGKMVK